MSENSITKTINNSGEVLLIQNEIEIYTKKIEHEKINLRLAKERYQKQLDILLKLQGKPRMIKEKKQKSVDQKSRRSVKDYPKPDKTKQMDKYEIIEQEIAKNDIILEKIINETNLISLENQDIRKKAEELRKEKLTALQMVNMLTTQGTLLSKELEELQIQNMINEGKSDKKKERKLKMLRDKNGYLSSREPDETQTGNFKEKGALYLKELELKSQIEKARSENKDFEGQREQLEGNYQEIIEENIRREREHMKEALKKKVGDYKNEENAKLEEDETIRDRTPILDLLIDKLKYFNTDKKKMIERYQRNSYIIKEALEQMMEYLGIDSYSDLPIVLEKMQDQHSSIEMLDSKLTDEIDKLEKEKADMENKIKNLKIKNSDSIDTKNNFVSQRYGNIDRLMNQIQTLNFDISKRRNFFTSLKEPTDDILNFFDNIFISEYIPMKVSVNKDVDYNESNVNDIIANIQDYLKIILEIEKSSIIEKKVDNSKELDRLKNDMSQKLTNLNKEIVASSFFKTDIKPGMASPNNSNSSFDDIIRSKALEIISRVNQISEQNDKKKKK